MHNEGFVHRDLKLENIMFRDKGSLDVKIVDFGFSE
jgi:serine/threonine protein kinase